MIKLPLVQIVWFVYIIVTGQEFTDDQKNYWYAFYDGSLVSPTFSFTVISVIMFYSIVSNVRDGTSKIDMLKGIEA